MLCSKENERHSCFSVLYFLRLWLNQMCNDTLRHHGHVLYHQSCKFVAGKNDLRCQERCLTMKVISSSKNKNKQTHKLQYTHTQIIVEDFNTLTLANS